MGLFDFLGGRPDDQKNIDKIKRRLTDPFRQTHERYEAMDQLVKIGTPAALEALLERFSYRVSGPTVDEEEKQYGHDQVSKFGDLALEPLKRYIATHDTVYFPLKSLREMAGDEVAVDVLLDTIASADPGYHQGLDRLREIVSNLRDFRHDRVRHALAGLLASRSDEVRFYALDGLAAYPAEQVAEHFAARMLDPAESQRVKALAWELALEHGLPLAPWLPALGPAAPPMYRIDPEGHVVRAGS